MATKYALKVLGYEAALDSYSGTFAESNTISNVDAPADPYLDRGLWVFAAADDARPNGVLALIVAEVGISPNNAGRFPVFELSYDTDDVLDSTFHQPGSHVRAPETKQVWRWGSLGLARLRIAEGVVTRQLDYTELIEIEAGSPIPPDVADWDYPPPAMPADYIAA